MTDDPSTHEIAPSDDGLARSAEAGTTGDGATDGPVTTPADASEAPHVEASPDPDGSALPTVALQAVLEALLMVTDEPVGVDVLAHAAAAPVDDVRRTLTVLADELVREGRGFELRQVAGGWRMYSRPDCAPFVERLLLDGQQARLTQAALETLAVIAYRQPVTRSRVSAVRGVNVDGVVRTLQARGLIVDAGQDPDSAGTLYRTTALFLERLGLDSLDGLPALAPLLPELDELDEASTFP